LELIHGRKYTQPLACCSFFLPNGISLLFVVHSTLT
jgi:hypothetical protein